MERVRYDIMDDMGRRDAKAAYPTGDVSLEPDRYHIRFSFVIISKERQAPVDTSFTEKISERLNYLCSVHRAAINHSLVRISSPARVAYSTQDAYGLSGPEFQPGIFLETRVTFTKQFGWTSVIDFLMNLDKTTRLYSESYPISHFCNIIIYFQYSVHSLWYPVHKPLIQEIMLAAREGTIKLLAGAYRAEFLRMKKIFEHIAGECLEEKTVVDIFEKTRRKYHL